MVNPPLDKAGYDAAALIGQRMPSIMSRLHESYPNSKCTLQYDNAFELLVATILLGNASEAEVNIIAPQLFAEFATPQAFVDARRELIEAIIRPLGFYRQKAKHLQLMSEVLLHTHNGVVPMDMTALTKLPGVARKGANIILSELQGTPDGIAVDTHVKRISKRLGLARGKSTETIERQLKLHVPSQHWIAFPYLLARHGDVCCSVQLPACQSCPLMTLCPSATV